MTIYPPTHSFIHSFNRYLLSTYYLSVTVVDIGGIAGEKIMKTRRVALRTVKGGVILRSWLLTVL